MTEGAKNKQRLRNKTYRCTICVVFISLTTVKTHLIAEMRELRADIYKCPSSNGDS